MSGCLLSISQSLSLSVSLCLCVSLSLFHSHSLFFCLLSLPLLLSSVSVWFCAFRIIGLQSHSQHLNHVVHCHCLSSALSPSLSPSLSLCISLAPTVGLLVGCKYPCYISILIAQVSQGPGIYILHIYFIVLAKRPRYFRLNLTTNILLHGPVHYQQGGVSLFKKVMKGSIYSS